MKKGLLLGLVALLVLGISAAASAWMGGPGGMMGGGYGPHMMGYGAQGQGWGPGGMRGGGPCWQGAQGATAAVIDDAKAKQIASDYASKNLPGYKVEKLVKFDRPRGSMYQVELKGPKDEISYLHINRFGSVMVFGSGRSF